MSRRSVYLPALSNFDNETAIRIVGDEHRHLLVARAEPGELIDVFDGLGRVVTARVQDVGKRDSLVEIVERRQANKDPCELTLGLALIRTAAFELALEKAVEIGVSRIIPFNATRSNAAPPRRLDRWLKIVVEAAKQSKRFHLPVLEEPAPFDLLLRLSAPTKIVFAERGGGSLQSAVAGCPAIYLVGPEGGWTDSELGQLTEHGFAPVSLGSGIMRAETAAIVGGALIRYAVTLMG